MECMQLNGYSKVLILEGKPEIGAHVWSDLGYETNAQSICLIERSNNLSYMRNMSRVAI